MKVFAGSAEFKSLKREIDVVRSLPSHENIVMLFVDEEEVRPVITMLMKGAVFVRVGLLGDCIIIASFPAALLPHRCKY